MSLMVIHVNTVKATMSLTRDSVKHTDIFSFEINLHESTK